MRAAPFRLVALLCLSLSILSACAPSVTGATSTSAFDLGTSQRIELPEGNRWYFALDFPYVAFGLTGGEFGSAVTGDPVPGQVVRSNATSTFGLDGVDVPAGWRLSLASVEAIKRVQEADAFTVSYSYTLSTRLQLDLPADAEPGSYDLSARIVAANGRSQALAFTVVVAAR